MLSVFYNTPYIACSGENYLSSQTSIKTITTDHQATRDHKQLKSGFSDTHSPEKREVKKKEHCPSHKCYFVDTF